MHLNIIMPTENEEVEKVVLNSVIMKLLSLGFYKLYKGVRFLWFVFGFLTQFCMWRNNFLVCYNFLSC